MLRTICFGFGLLALGVSRPSYAQPDDDDDDEVAVKMRAPAPAAAEFDFEADFAAEVAAPELDMDMPVETPGVAVGGARDVDLVRSRLESGRIPEPALLASEGFLAGYDLPLTPAPACSQKLCINTQTVATTLIAHPEVHYLTQIGFGSDLDLSTFQRPPLHAVVLLDLSPSMAGNPINTARTAIITLADQMQVGDRITILGFGLQPQVLLPTTVMPNQLGVAHAVVYAQLGGATALERALHSGFQVARRSPPGFVSRVFLVTDDRPTVGRTNASPFLTIAERGAGQGIGLTTIGVGPHFQAPLARALAGLRGGNTLFLRDPTQATQRLTEEFESLVTELAYALEISIEPAPGMEVSHVFGVPGDILKRTGDVVSLRVETLFLSKKRGAIFFALAPRGRANLPRGPVRTGAQLGHVRIQYRELDGTLETSRSQLRNLHPARVGTGLRRGTLLIEQMEVLRAIAEMLANGTSLVEADAMAAKLQIRFENVTDSELIPAVELMGMLRGIVSQTTVRPARTLPR